MTAKAEVSNILFSHGTLTEALEKVYDKTNKRLLATGSHIKMPPSQPPTKPKL